MMITRKNYEEWLIDWLDGSLTVEQVDALRLFLRENTDLQEEFNGIENARLIPEEIDEIDVSTLKKSIFDEPDTLEDACIRSLENELDADEEKQLQAYLLRNPLAANEYALFKATILKPDETVCYSDINALKKRVVLFPYFYKAAAAVVLLVSFFWWQQYDTSTINLIQNQVVALNEMPQPSLNIAYYQPELLAAIEPVRKSQPAENIPPREDFGKMQLLAARTINIMPSEISNEITDFQMKTANVIAPSPKERYPGVAAYLIEKVDITKNKNRLFDFALGKIKRVSNSKVDYSTNQDGEIERVELNTRILALSIPVN